MTRLDQHVNGLDAPETRGLCSFDPVTLGVVAAPLLGRLFGGGGGGGTTVKQDVNNQTSVSVQVGSLGNPGTYTLDSYSATPGDYTTYDAPISTLAGYIPQGRAVSASLGAPSALSPVWIVGAAALAGYLFLRR